MRFFGSTIAIVAVLLSIAVWRGRQLLWIDMLSSALDVLTTADLISCGLHCLGGEVKEKALQHAATLALFLRFTTILLNALVLALFGPKVALWILQRLSRRRWRRSRP